MTDWADAKTKNVVLDWPQLSVALKIRIAAALREARLDGYREGEKVIDKNKHEIGRIAGLREAVEIATTVRHKSSVPSVDCEEIEDALTKAIEEDK